MNRVRSLITLGCQLYDEGLKDKKKQKIMKAGFEARARARREKEREREKKEMEEKRELEEREADLKGWASRMKREQEVCPVPSLRCFEDDLTVLHFKALMTRIKERARRKAALSDRKSAAAQARMKSIT